MNRRQQTVLDLVRLFPGRTASELMVEYDRRRWCLNLSATVYPTLYGLEHQGLIRSHRREIGRDEARHEYFLVEPL